MPNFVTYLIRTHEFEWYVVRCHSNNIYQKDMCLEEVGLRGQNMIISLGSIVNKNWGGG
jgi:hypothetical protein